jgi:pimeloyl-ACP methyl ester carboxylesterase
MTLSICAVLLLIASVPTALFVYRKLRQAKAAATLRIESGRGVVEQRFVRIGGIDQWISIRGEDRNNPVLLVIHGGPGSCYSIFTPHLRPWEKHFTMVQWDQRGAGRTFTQMGPRGSGEISMKQLTSDAIELAEYLRAKLGQDRLFLLASSIGSIIGVQVSLSRPDMFYAYIGTDQNVGMVRGREENHRQLLDRLRARGMTRGVRAVERIGADATRWTRRDFETVAQWTMKSDPDGFHGFHRTIKLLKDAVWFAPGWKLRDIRGFVKGMHLSLEQLLPEIVRYDAWAQGTRFECAVFIFQGEDDVLTPTADAWKYFAEIEAPVKTMELIPDVGHFAMFLQPEQFLEKLLTYVLPLAYGASIEIAKRSERRGVTAT